MLYNNSLSLAELRDVICKHYLEDETSLVNQLLPQVELSTRQIQRIRKKAESYISFIRNTPPKGVDALLQEYQLATEDGVALMCLAESLLRIPDPTTVDRLIEDKLSVIDWEKHLGNSESIFVNASTWGLMLSGHFITLHESTHNNITLFLKRLIKHSSEATIRNAIKSAMKIIAQQFVMQQSIEAATERCAKYFKHYSYSFDMLGEASLTQQMVTDYFKSYLHTLDYLGQQKTKMRDNQSGLSIKLSALHPRFEFRQKQRCLDELLPRLQKIITRAKLHNISITIDAEESANLDLTLDIFESLYTSNAISDWKGLGIVVQAYQKRAIPVINWLVELAKTQQQRINIRLVKGAYWDSEIKQAQYHGYDSYPVFTRKQHTDLNYLACVKLLFKYSRYVYPQFATHNATTISTILELAGDYQDYEFQRLHGMAEDLYDYILENEAGTQCRIYAPVGDYKSLLPYLVRRLLENGANTSFINRLSDHNVAIDKLTQYPADIVRRDRARPHRHIEIPAKLYLPERINSKSYCLSNPCIEKELLQDLNNYAQQSWTAINLNFKERYTEITNVINPAEHNDIVGKVYSTPDEVVIECIQQSQIAFTEWQHTSLTHRVQLILALADKIEQHYPELLSLLTREAGRCIRDALNELREAVDYCRYYAAVARKQFSTANTLQGPTGELNQLSYQARGIICCISPWNFPVAIFLGQVCAALITGNTVLAKPSSATPLSAARLIELMHDCGIPQHVIELLLVDGKTLNRIVLSDHRIQGVLFTGSTDTAQLIQQTLTTRGGSIIPLIAETGGINAMIIDSSALLEQAVKDIIESAFNSAGQRCSALRILYIQNDIFNELITLLKGALDEVIVGNPGLLTTDMGPVINQTALDALTEYINQLENTKEILYRGSINNQLQGFYFPPHLIKLNKGSALTKEVFGPVLHIVSYSNTQLNEVIETINQSGYGLTLGIHSRIKKTIEYITRRVKVGNIYINRNMIGAVVGVQPFGGHALSGTGPKAGGPNYLRRLMLEKVISNNISAAGGDSGLLSLEDD